MLTEKDFKDLTIDEILAKKKQLIEQTKWLDNHTGNLLNRKAQLLNEIEQAKRVEIAPRQDEISQIEAEIEKIMRETGQDKVSSEFYTAYKTSERSIRITDKDKAWTWIQMHPEVLKKDIIKTSAVNKLIDEGVVPDPQADGIDCNETYEKINYRRK